MVDITAITALLKAAADISKQVREAVKDVSN
jgi:hypothetical protein